MENEIEIPKRIIKTRKRIGQIYIIRNYVNDKVYVGETTAGYKNRFKNHCKKSTRTYRNYKLYDAMDELGVENFYVELLEDNVPIEKMYEREIYNIEKYDSFYNGYNSTKGGNGRLINKVSDIKEILELYAQGKSSTEISEIFNINPTTILRTLRRYNIEARANGNKYERFDEQKFIELWNNKSMKITEIAEYFNVHKRTIKRFANRLSLPPRHSWSTKKKV